MSCKESYYIHTFSQYVAWLNGALNCSNQILDENFLFAGYSLLLWSVISNKIFILQEEEDKYDREAFGREDAFDRVYMNEIMDDGINMSINTVVPDILDDSVEEIHRFSRDPRADMGAASARLKEYDSSAKGGTCSLAQPNEFPSGRIQAMKTDDANVKPILKRKEEQGDSKPRKRVKFAADVKDQSAELPEQDEDSPMVPQSMDLVIGKDSSTPSESPGVPDYVKNPAKYTRYTLDTPECNDETNRRAFADLHDILRRMEPEPEAPPVEIPTSVTFIPRKKTIDAMTVDEGPKSNDANSSLIGLAAGASDETEQCEMDEDDPKALLPPQVQTNTKMNSRRYRSSRTDDE